MAIAVVVRTDDVEDKLVAAVAFQEQFFTSGIIVASYDGNERKDDRGTTHR